MQVDIAELDLKHCWHPYSPAQLEAPLPVVVGAKGAELTLADGRVLVDGMSSWWAAIHGYQVPQIDSAVSNQLNSFSHVMFGGLTHQPAAELASLLAQILPGDLTRVFFSDSGSVAMEVAVKLAIQVQIARGLSERSRLMTWRSGYHGDTFKTMSISDSDGGGMHSQFSNVLEQQHYIAAPPACSGLGREELALDKRAVDHVLATQIDAYILELQKFFAQNADQAAAFVVEPIVQNAGGIRIHHPQLLKAIRELCDRHKVLLVFDEIATGFGRTGKLFASEWADVVPDIMAVGKALSGGYLSLAATVCSDELAAELANDGSAGLLMHGPTYMANPLATAAALASTRLLLDSDWQTKVLSIENQFAANLTAATDIPGVKDVRNLGAIAAIELVDPVNTKAAADAAAAHGVWLRPFGNLIYSMPPYICNEDQIQRIASAMCAAASASAEKF